MKDIKDFAKKWKEFKDRQERVYQRNLHSQEYVEAEKTVKMAMEVAIKCVYFPIPVPWFLTKSVLKKDMYEDSIEGMLNWINDDEPAFGKVTK